MGKYFGTDGFRGEANVKLNAMHAYKIGRFLGRYYKAEAAVRVVIGKDTRRSGDMLEEALAAGLTASGADVYLLSVVPTPCVAYVVRKEKFSCGIMISASHNPFYDNGIKVIDGEGHKLGADVEERLEAYIDEKEDSLPFARREEIGNVTLYPEGKKMYLSHLKGLVKHSFAGKKIALDCSNGSAYATAKQIFDELGADTYVISDRPDGLNINKDCGSTHIGPLREYVKTNKMDAGFAYDGDADRCLCVDESGNVVDGDAILYICGCNLAEKGELPHNTVVTTVMSNLGLYKAFDARGVRYEKTAVGDKYVYENMTRNGYALGGEQSGHIIFGQYATTGDGVLTSLMMMEVMMEKGQGLSELKKELYIYPQLLINVPVTDKEAVLKDEEVRKAEKEVEEALGDEGRILLRVSGTEPLVRVMVEARTDELCQEKAGFVAEIIRRRWAEK